MSLTGFGFSDSAALLKHFKYGPRHLLQLPPPLRPFDAGVLIAQIRWDAEKLTERYFEDPEKVAAAVVCHPCALLWLLEPPGQLTVLFPPPSLCVS